MTSHPLKRRYNLLSAKRFLCWMWMSCGPLSFVEKRGKRLILSVGIIPYGNSWHAFYVRRCLFPNVLKCMRQVALEASSTQTAGEATMGWWTWATKSISGCIMVSMSLPAVIAISMALSHSGHMPNGGLQSS